MKKILSFIIIIAISLSVSSCGKYVSSYSAIGMVRTSYDDHCEARFHSLSGSIVFNVRKTTPSGEIKYRAAIEEGELNVYYDADGERELLFNLTPSDEIISHGGYAESGKTVYIIVEASRGTRGYVYIDF